MKRWFLILLTFDFIVSSIQAQDSLNINALSSLYNFWGNPQGVVVVGDYAFVSDMYAGLDVLDISNPNNPLEIGNCTIAGHAEKIFVDADNPDYAFIHRFYNDEDENDMVVVDISLPENPEVIANIPISSVYPSPDVVDVIIDGDYLYIATSNIGLKIFNISNINNVVQVPQSNSYNLVDMDKAGDIIFALQYSPNRLIALDVSQPNSPSIVDSLDIIYVPGKMAVSGDYVYFTDVWNIVNILHVVNISNPANLVEVGTVFDVESCVHSVQGNYCYLWEPCGAIYIYNIAQPAIPFFVSSYVPNYITSDVFISEGYLYLTLFDSKMEIADISNPAIPSWVSTYDKCSRLTEAQISGNYAYVLDYYDGLRIVNIEEYADPYEEGVLSPNEMNYFNDLEVVNNTVYLAEYGAGMKMVNVANPTSPIEIGLYADVECKFVQVADNFAYIIGEDGDFYVIDVSNPANCVQTGHLSLSTLTYDMYLDYPLVYIASDDCGFRILNVSNPVNPVTVFYGDLGGSSINTIKIQDDYAYLANNSGDLMVMDISNLSTPAIIDTFPFPGEIEDLALIGDTLYLVNMERVYALSIAIPDTVTIMGYYDTPGIATGVAVDTGIVVVADCFSLRLYQYEYPNAVFSYNEDIPKSYCLSPVNPNPFNYQTQLNFDISQPGKVTITVYNLNGRQVMEIAQGYYFPGEYTINWNAEDLASGLYLVELKQNGYSAVQKAVLLK